MGWGWGGKYYLWLMDMKGKVSPHFLIDGVAGEILNTFQNPLGFHFMVLEEKPLSKGNVLIPKRKNKKCNGHKMAAEAKILERTVARVGITKAKAIQ